LIKSAQLDDLKNKKAFFRAFLFCSIAPNRNRKVNIWMVYG
jgi:hypothetical protein